MGECVVGGPCPETHNNLAVMSWPVSKVSGPSMKMMPYWMMVGASLISRVWSDGPPGMAVGR